MIQLREYRQSDIDRLVELANNRNVSQYMTSSFPFPYTREDAAWWVSQGAQNSIAKVIESNGVFVGGIGAQVESFEYSKRAMLGYWVGQPHWGCGIASKALMLFSEQMFATTDVVRLQASVFSINKASMKVLEKAGFEQEAILKKAINKEGVFYDEHIFSLIKDM